MARTIRSITARFVRKYEQELPRYSEAAKTAEELVRDILADVPVQIHVITARFKRLDSIRLKLRKKKYRRPGRQLTDKVGVRVITYFENDITPIVALLKRELEVDEHKSEDKRTKLSLREFGYRSVHLIARTKGRWSRLSRFATLEGLWFEIQVRSILEHAWAEIEHEIVYKSGIAFPDETKRQFARLAGAIEILENEFFALRGARCKLVESLVLSTEGQLYAKRICQCRPVLPDDLGKDTHDHLLSDNFRSCAGCRVGCPAHRLNCSTHK